MCDLYFLFHNFGVQIIPFKTKFKKNISRKEKKDIPVARNVHKAPFPGM